MRELQGTCRENPNLGAISFHEANRNVPSTQRQPGRGTVFQIPASPSVGSGAL